MMKSGLVFGFCLFMLYSCQTSYERKNEAPNLVASKVYEFDDSYDTQDSLFEKAYIKLLAFPDDDFFIMTYDNNFTRYFCRGKYDFNSNRYTLHFEDKSYTLNYESAYTPDNTQLPVVISNNCHFDKTNLVLNEDEGKLYRVDHENRQEGNPSLLLSGEDVPALLKLEKMDFILDKSTLKTKTKK